MNRLSFFDIERLFVAVCETNEDLSDIGDPEENLDIDPFAAITRIINTFASVSAKTKLLKRVEREFTG